MTLKDESEKELALELFLKIGLDERTAKNTVANNKVTSSLLESIREVIINMRWYVSFFEMESVCFVSLILWSFVIGFFWVCLFRLRWLMDVREPLGI